MKKIIEEIRQKVFMMRFGRKLEWIFDNLPINLMDDETDKKTDEIIGIKLWLTKKGRGFNFITKNKKEIR